MVLAVIGALAVLLHAPVAPSDPYATTHRPYPPTGYTARPPTMALQLLCIRSKESGDNYRENTGNGQYGAYQFGLSTWYGLGYRGYPSSATATTQDLAAVKLEKLNHGWRAWPYTRLLCNLR